jgi:hypothetical protein
MTDYRYASGEEPREGDIVRSLKDAPTGPRGVGDVFTCLKLSSYGGGVYYNPYTHGAPDTFELIARAGEPVRYQPGDVVEVLPAAYLHARFPGRCTVTEGNNPGRNGVTAKTPNGAGLFREHEIKLVHRPDKAEPLTFTPPKAEPQVGDRVRVTFEAELSDMNQTGSVARVTLGGLVRRHDAKVEVIAEKPLAVGDEVAYPTSPPIGVIRSIDEGKAWVRMREGNAHRTIELRSLVRTKR